MPSDYLPLLSNTNQAINNLRHDDLAQKVLHEISTEIKNNAAQRACYDEALKILARRKFCVKKSLEKLYQAQQTELQITEIITALKNCRADLCNGIDHDTTYLINLANQVLNILEMCYGASLTQTIPIRSDLDSFANQKNIFINALAAILQLYTDLKQLFEINFFNTIATYATQNVAPIYHSNVPLISFLMARSIDNLKPHVNTDIARQALNEIPDAGATEMFEYTFNIKKHTETFVKEFKHIVNYFIAPQQYTVISYTTETIKHQNAVKKSNETTLGTTDKKKPTYAEIAKKKSDFLKPYVQLFGDDLKLLSKKSQDNINPPSLKKSTSMLNIQNASKNLLNKKYTNPSNTIKKNNPIIRTQSMLTITNDHNQKQHTTKKKLQKWKHPFLAFGQLFKKSDDAEKNSLPVVPEDMEEENEIVESNETRKELSNGQPTQENEDNLALAEFAKKAAQEQKQQPENKNQNTTKTGRPIKQLLAESKSLFEEYYIKTKTGLPKYKHLSDQSIRIKNIAIFLNSATPLIEELTLAAEKTTDKKTKKLLFKEKNELFNTSKIIKEQIIPNSIKNFSHEITRLKFNTPERIIIDLSNIIDETDKANISEHYIELFKSSRMKVFLKTLTDLTKEHFFASDEPLDQCPQEQLMGSINDRIMYLAAICKIKKTFADIISPNKKEISEKVETIEKYLEAIKTANDKNKILLLKKLIGPSFYQKMFYITLQYKHFELSKLLVLNDDFKPTEKDLYIADHNGALEVVYLLLNKGANPFSLYKNGDMPFTHIITSGNSNNIILSLTLIEKHYDDLSKSKKLPLVVNTLFQLLSEKSKLNVDIRNAINWILKKRTELRKITSAVGLPLEENAFFKELAAEQKLLEYLRESQNSPIHKSKAIYKLHALEDDQIFELGPSYQMYILDTLIVYAQLSIEEKIITLPELKNKTARILRKIYKNIGIDRTLELIESNNLLKLNIYIPLAHILAEYAHTDSDVFNLLKQILSYIEKSYSEQHKQDFINYPATATNATLLHITLQYENYQAASMLIFNGSNLMATNVHGISAADLLFHSNYRKLALFEYLCDMPKEYHAKILTNSIYSAEATENAQQIIMRLVELEDDAGHTLTEFLALHKKENFVITLLEHGSCAAPEKIKSLYKIAQRTDCYIISTYLQDHYKTIRDAETILPSSTNPYRLYNAEKPHTNLSVIHEQPLPDNSKLKTSL